MSNLKPLIPGQYGSSSKEIKQNDLTMMVDEDVDVISKSMSNMGLHMSNTNPRISENAGKIFSSARKSTKEGIMAMLENGRKSVRKALAFEGTTMFDNDDDKLKMRKISAWIRKRQNQLSISVPKPCYIL